ncbi:tetratricopeptide repeat protein [Fulvivirga sp. 29W222]|uniref:Tetratricopeptide repeat protein n=1 Tax=Fulvivirga marina TaxID=2494733 RepID=A0A937FXW3_9BACT|nr:tetratricopeptide repeat protein [Fulvivirga marina]MBL6446451.1 tetratricopeptide repeat protein [Fulvivirga marina]
MQEEKHRALIDKYLTDTLTEGEKKDFILLMENPEFKEAVLHEKHIVAALKAKEKAKLKANLKSFSSRIPTTPQQTSNTKRLWMAAASVILIVSIGYFIYMNNQPISNQFINYYEPYPAVTIQRGEGEKISKALQLYSEEKYQEAVDELTSLASPDQQAYYLYLGNCYLQLDETQKAITTFEKLIEISNDSILTQHSQWYLAMAHLKANQSEPLKILLRNIINQNGMYSELAHNLLKEID